MEKEEEKGREGQKNGQLNTLDDLKFKLTTSCISCQHIKDSDFFIFIQKTNQISKNNRTGVKFRKLPKPVNG